MQKKIVISLIFICVAMIIAAGCLGGGSANVQKSPQVATPEPPVAKVKMSWANGVVTSDVTNSGSTVRSFMLVVDFYDGDVKVDTRYVDIPTLDPGETGRAKGAAPPGANKYELTAVTTTIGGKLYKVTYDVSYS
jgi:hypothetical protein